jgi:ribonuclease T1
VFSTGLASSGADSSQSPSRSPQQAFFRWGAVGVTATCLLVGGAFSLALARDTGPVKVVPLSSLPVEAQATQRLILSGGPFPYDKDGIVFGNRERVLPAKARGYYREYTVKTPGSRNRGARRIVCGGQPPTQPEACFYSDDHYASFRRIAL